MKCAFTYISDANFADLLIESVKRSLVFYPEAKYLVYDWGMTDQQKSKISSLSSNVIVIDWVQNINALNVKLDEITKDDIYEAIQNNSRNKKLKRKINKFFLKKFPKSNFTRKIVIELKTLELKFAEKVNCFIDASSHVGNFPMITIDADAFLIRNIDKLINMPGDISVGLVPRENRSLKRNNFKYINVGVVHFTKDPERRLEVLKWWKDLTSKSDEIWREQSALGRELLRQTPNLFEGEESQQFIIGSNQYVVTGYECKQYNNQYLKTYTKENLKDVSVIHFVDRQKENFKAKLAQIDNILKGVS